MIRDTRYGSRQTKHAQEDTVVTRTVPTKTDADAREFGLHVKQGGWRLGLLVARNVVRAPGRVAVSSLAPKTNATRFADRAHTTVDRVLRHLNAWEAAADAGLVPHAATLSPGTEIDIDADALPAWTTFYHPEVRRAARPRSDGSTGVVTHTLVEPGHVVTTTDGTIPQPSPFPETGGQVPPTLDDAVDPDNRLAAAIAHLTETPEEATARAEAETEQALAESRARTTALVEAEAARLRAAQEAVEQAGEVYRSGHTTEGTPIHRSTDPEAARLAIHNELRSEVRELIGKMQWTVRRLFDISRDPDWNAEGREQAAEDLKSVGANLLLVADIAADPDTGRVTEDETARLFNQG